MLTITSRLQAAFSGRYRIERELDTGGMAVVYAARDLRHDRKVAIKVFRPELSAVLGPERFGAEIHISANLQHPHILPLFDSGAADGLLYYVMPYVEGESLRARLLREKQLSVDESVRIAVQVASALEYAHRHNVIHRDIKPENVLLQEGEVLVADFGIALAVEQSGGNRLTETGLSLGTPQYMSPEQATGERELDHRSDIYSLGVLLYEMLAGAPPHTGPTVQAVVAKILTENPRPIGELRRTTPVHIASAVDTALARIPADRFGSAHEFSHALTYPESTSLRVPIVAGARLVGPRPTRFERFRFPAIAGGCVLLGVAAGLGIMRVASAPSKDLPIRFVIETTEPQVDQLLGQLPLLTFTPDGKALVFTKGGMLHVRRLDRFESTPLAGTEQATTPAFSPDGRWLVFGQGGRLRKAPVAGGPIVDVVTVNYRMGAFWAEDDNIYFSAGLGDEGIWRVAASGGEPEQVTRLSDRIIEQAHGWPQVLPGGSDLLFTVLGPSGGPQDSRIAVETIGSGNRKTLVERAVYGRYSRSGHIIYGTPSGGVFAVPYDVRAQRVTGTPAPVLEKVVMGVWGGATLFAVSDQGTLVYVPGAQRELHILQFVDRGGRVLGGTGPVNAFLGATFSPDGRRIAATVREPTSHDVWVFSSASNEWERFTFAVAEDERAVWSPDSRAVAYTSAWTSRSGQARQIMVKEAVAGTDARILRGWPRHVHLSSWSPDGKWLAMYDYHPTNNEDTWLISTDGKDSLAVARTTARELNGVFSPDGRWLAYQSNESGGRFEIYVVAVPGLTVKRQVSRNGGAFPRWDPTGRALYFLERERLMTIPVSMEGGFSIRAAPTMLFATNAFEYDVSPDGRRFMLEVPNPATPILPIHVIVNWFSELRSGTAEKN